MPGTTVSTAVRVVACGLLATAPLSAAAQSDSARPRIVTSSVPEGRLCWRGSPLPRCRSYWLTEMSGEYAYATTKTHYRFDYGSVVNTYARPDVSSRLSWTIGPMFNTSPSSATGATVSAGFVNDGSRVAIEARRRWWSPDQQVQPTFDLSAGLVRMDVPARTGSFEHDAYGLTGGAYLVGGDLIQLNGRVDLLLTGGRVRAGGTVGAGLGSYAAAGATVLLGALTLAVIAIFASSGGDF
jgi:hypothetical protein